MKVIELVLLTVLTVTAFDMGCGKRSDSPAKFDGQLGVPLTMYDFSHFTNCQSFQARIESKHILSHLKKSSRETNFLFSIVLQKINGEECAVYEDPTSPKMVRIVSSLEEGHTYTFPD